MPVTTWNTGNPYNYVEVITQAFAVARGGAVKKFFNIYHFRRTSTINALSKTNINTAFTAAIVTPVLAALNVDYTETAHTFRFFENPIDAPTSFSAAGTGAIAGDRLPDFSAAVIQLHSGLRGKPYRGSKHYGPIAESDTTGDDLTSGALARFVTVGVAITTGFTDSDGNVWVAGLKGGVRVGSPAQYLTVPTTTVWTDIVLSLVNKSLGTMRRRKIPTVT